MRWAFILALVVTGCGGPTAPAEEEVCYHTRLDPDDPRSFIREVVPCIGAHR